MSSISPEEIRQRLPAGFYGSHHFTVAGATYVTIVGAPPTGCTHRIDMLWVKNQVAGAITTHFVIEELSNPGFTHHIWQPALAGFAQAQAPNGIIQAARSAGSGDGIYLTGDQELRVRLVTGAAASTYMGAEYVVY